MRSLIGGEQKGEVAAAEITGWECRLEELGAVEEQSEVLGEVVPVARIFGVLAAVQQKPVCKGDQVLREFVIAACLGQHGKDWGCSLL